MVDITDFKEKAWETFKLVEFMEQEVTTDPTIAPWSKKKMLVDFLSKMQYSYVKSE